jgi:murein DD-endopeptidase MepM/ murein hydrolase activator NlpD
MPIFNRWKNSIIGYVNLDTEARNFDKLAPKTNKFLDPVFCEGFVEQLHSRLGLTYSYGGWLEDRSYLWRTSYMEKKNNFIHVGLDVNVPYNTKVFADIEGIVVLVDSDYPEEGGWGNRVIVKHNHRDLYIIYAHLANGVQVKQGDRVSKDTFLGKVGKSSQNGFWFPHLHLQVVKGKHFRNLLKNNLKTLDGYVNRQELKNIKDCFLDPLNIFSLDPND